MQRLLLQGFALGFWKHDAGTVNMADGEGSCELLNYVQPDHRILSTGTITSRVMKPDKEKEDELKAQPLSAGFNNQLLDCEC